MAYRSVFHLMDETVINVEQIEAAVEKIRSSLPKSLNKTLFHDLLKGFQILVMLLNKKMDVYETIIKWLQLYLEVQAAVNPKSERLLVTFEKTVPPVVTYIIGCLQYKSQHIPSFHFQLLNMMHKLLTNVKMSTMQNLANFESGLIACLWFPINFVGDFNTQMMILRMLAMVLKCVDDVKQQNELDKIQCPQKHVFNKKLSKIIAFANYHEGVFENIARKLLNNYNMNLSKHVLVYSFRCKTLHFAAKIEFFKTLNSQNFWMDLNYCPRSLTFTARAKHPGLDTYRDVSVECHVCGLTLEKQTLIVQFKAPAKFSVELHDANLKDMNFLKLELPIDESLRLKENHFVMAYYNNQEQPVDSIISHAKNISNNDNNSIVDIIMMDKNANSNNFQNSYDFLIGRSSDSSDNQCSKAQCCSIQNATAQCAITNSASLLHPSNEQRLEYLETLHDDPTKIALINDNINGPHSHSVCEIHGKRRFFKTDKRSWESDVIQGGARKTKVSNKKRCIRRSTQNCKTLPTISNGLKQVNKVKPMNHTENNSLLSNTNRPSTVPRSLRILRSSTQKCQRQQFPSRGQLRPIRSSADVYENHYVSDAEPGQSYRSFQERQSLTNGNESMNDFQRSKIIDKQMREVPQGCGLAATKAQNKTLYSGEIEVDVSICNSYKLKRNNLHLAEINHQGQQPPISESPSIILESEEDDITNTKPKTMDISISSSKNSEGFNQTELPECRAAMSTTMPSPTMIFSIHNTNAANINSVPIASSSKSNNSNVNKSESNPMQISNSTAIFNGRNCNGDFTFDECILYCNRSDGTESSCDEFENHVPKNTNFNVVTIDTSMPFVHENLATESVITNQVTTTTTSIFSHVKNTRHSRLFSRDVNLAVLASTGPVVPSTELVPQRVHQTSQTGDDCGVSKRVSLGQNFDREEVLVNQAILDELETDIRRQFSNSLNQAKEKYVDVYVKRVNQLSESLLIEVEKEQNELRELEDMLERVLVQLKIQYETYKEKSQRFQNYRDKMGNLMQTLSKLNLDEQLNVEYENLMKDLQNSAQEKALTQWQGFMQSYTQDFLEKVSRLSNLWEK